MGIVDLDRRIVIQVMQIAAALYALLQYHLRARTDHKILLIDPQKPSRLITVIRIEE